MKMRRFAFIVAVFQTLAASVLAQSNTSGVITGVVIDEASRKPMEFVNIVVRKTSDSVIVAGTETDTKGMFRFADIPEGEYFIRLSFIGFEDKITASRKMDKRQGTWNVGTISLSESSVKLDEVLVTAQKALFTNSIDRKVYNVGQDIMSKTGSTSELLQSIPSLDVDIDGNVSLRGSSNVLFLINGKSSPLMERSSATVLQQMPASSIERIELITNPSAKYDAEGAAGITCCLLA